MGGLPFPDYVIPSGSWGCRDSISKSMMRGDSMKEKRNARKKSFNSLPSIESINEAAIADHVFQYAQPERFLLPEETQPAVKHGNGNAVMLTKMFYRDGPDKISPQDNEEESQGIRFIRDDAGRQACVGMSTGITDIPWYSNCAHFCACPSHSTRYLL